MFEANTKKKIENGDIVHPSPEVKLGVKFLLVVNETFKNVSIRL